MASIGDGAPDLLAKIDSHVAECLRQDTSVREVPAECFTPSPHMWCAAFSWAIAYSNALTRQTGEGREALADCQADLRPLLRLRYATRDDAPAMMRFIRELAEFEREPEAVKTTENTFIRDGLTDKGLGDLEALAASPPMFHAVIAEICSDAAGPIMSSFSGGGGGDLVNAGAEPAYVPVAMALAHPSYSTWEGRTLYLEDLYVSPPFRRRGVSKALFAALARAAAVSQCARLQWSVLAWNQMAVDAYDAMGATRLEDWRLYRLYRADVERVAGLRFGGDAS